MCGRFLLTEPEKALRDLFGISSPRPVRPRWNIAPGQEVLAVRREEDGQLQATSLNWGLIPPWARDPSIGSRLINARAETAAEKPAFREALRKRRCILPADGFFEWQREGRRRRPYRIALRSHRAFGMAGLWEAWNDHSGIRRETCSILTTGANSRVAPIHHRMPVLLRASNCHDWLVEGALSSTDFERLCQPFPGDDLLTTELGPAVNDPRRDDPGVLQPPGGSGHQAELFS